MLRRRAVNTITYGAMVERLYPAARLLEILKNDYLRTKYTQLHPKMPSKLYTELSKFKWTVYSIRIMFENLYYIADNSTEYDIIECLVELKNKKIDITEVLDYAINYKKPLNKVALWCLNDDQDGLEFYNFKIFFERAVNARMDLEVIEAIVNSHSRAFSMPPDTIWQLHITKSILYGWAPQDMVIPIAQLCIKYGKSRLSDNEIDMIIAIINRGAAPQLEAAIVILIRAHLREKRLLRAAKLIAARLKERVFAPDHIWRGCGKTTVEKYRPAELKN